MITQIPGLKVLELKDLLGGWNTEDNAWNLRPNEMTTLEDFDLTKLSLARRDNFGRLCMSFPATSINKVLGIHQILSTLPEKDRFIITIQHYEEEDNDNWANMYNFQLGTDYNNYGLISLDTLATRVLPYPTYAVNYRNCIFVLNGLEARGFKADILMKRIPTGLTQVNYALGFIAKYPLVYSGSLWVANMGYAGNLIFATGYGLLPHTGQSWNDVYLDEDYAPVMGYSIQVGGDEEITAFIGAFGNLYAFKRDSVWIIEQGDTGIGGYTCKEILQGFGTINQRTVVVAYNSIFFLSPEGKVYMWNGTQDLPVWISRDIDSYLRTIYLDEGDKIVRHSWNRKEDWEDDWTNDPTNPVEIKEAGHLEVDDTSGLKIITLTKAIDFSNDLTLGESNKDVSAVIVKFSVDKDWASQWGTTLPVFLICYHWCNSETYEPTEAEWYQSYESVYSADCPLGAISIPAPPSGYNYLKLRIYINGDYGNYDNSDRKIYGVTIVYGESQIYGKGTQTNPYRNLRFCTPCMFFDKNMLMLAVSDNFKDYVSADSYQINSTYWQKPPTNNSLLVFTIPLGQKKYTWVKWNNRYEVCHTNITNNITKESFLLLGCGKYLENTQYFIEIYPRNSNETFNSGACRQKFETAILDCGTPDNDKTFVQIALSYADRSAGDFQFGWKVFNQRTGEYYSNYITLTLTGDGQAKSKIIQLLSPGKENSLGSSEIGPNYGQRIQLSGESIADDNVDYGEIDILSIRLYYLPKEIVPETGEESGT